MSKPEFDGVLGRVPSGLFILTVGSGERATGMLTSWVMQAGFEPPMITVAVRLGRYVEEWLTRGEPFVLNLVEENNLEMIKHFGKGFEPDEPAFNGLNIKYCPRAVPILADCLGHLECEPVSHVDSGDHRIFLAKVVRGALQSDTMPTVHIRKSGSNY